MGRANVTHLCWGDVTNVFGRQLFQQGGLASVVQAEQQQAHLLLRGLLQPSKDGQQTLHRHQFKDREMPDITLHLGTCTLFLEHAARELKHCKRSLPQLVNVV